MLNKFKLNKSGKGFTLIELLLVLAIISILSGTILVSVSSHKKRAEEAKMQAQLSGAIQDMVVCRSDEGAINEPNGTAGGGNICSLSGDYGAWPATGGSTDFGDYVSDTDFEDGVWFVHTDDGKARICCNSSSNQCQHLVSGAACTAITP